MTAKDKVIAKEFLPLRGLCEDVNAFLTCNGGRAPDIKMKVLSATDIPGKVIEDIVDITSLVVRMNNYIAMLEAASRDLIDTGSPERLLAVRAAREKIAPQTGNIIIPKGKLIH